MAFTSSIHEVCHGLFRQLIPSREHQVAFEWSYAPDAFLYQIPFMLMAYLVRRKDTHFIRLLLLPVVVVPALRGTFRYYGTEPDFFAFSWMRGIVCFSIIAACLDFAFTTEGKLKIGESTLPPIGNSFTAANADASSKGSPKASKKHFLSGLVDALEVTTCPRGIGWKDSEGTAVPKSVLPQTKPRFLLWSLFILIKNFLLMDLCDILLRAFPDICNPTGGSMFYRHLPPLQRYIISTIIQLIFGFFGFLAITTTQVWMSMIGVGILGHSPADWPPLMDNPWGSTSLHEFWSKRWHQMMRRPLMVLGGIPGRWLAGRVGMVFGVFIASGLFHEFSAYVLPGSLDHRVTLFFTLQAVGILLEDLYRKITGKRVGGLAGRAWACFFVIGLGQLCVDVWLIRGIAGHSGYLPPHISPAKHFVSPTVYPLVERVLKPWY